MYLMDKGAPGQKSTVPAFGPQADLCRITMCCVCHAIEVIRAHSSAWDPYVMKDYDWAKLPTLAEGANGEQVIDPHHEPRRGTALRSDDSDTIPVCRTHHTGTWTRRRHTPLYDRAPELFWEFFGIDWVAVRDEMRRRVALNAG